ncbi:hypothetical protein San01_07300 [Streptomyces angustmyceticus]|uniref:Uncharacterized protein n=1 Tax=Streptomyces angustmyceticus TaxID=285578 RepID=A0A5J4L241_9ACTN|nr:hypothetical protein San01_07300 [Streptomyces angustmyceticus]
MAGEFAAPRRFLPEGNRSAAPPSTTPFHHPFPHVPCTDLRGGRAKPSRVRVTREGLAPGPSCIGTTVPTRNVDGRGED